MRPIRYILFCGVLVATNAAASSCKHLQDRVSKLPSELIIAAYINNEPGRDRKIDLELAAKLGEPLALSLLATRDELRIEKRIEYLQYAASIEYSPANTQLVELVLQISKPISPIEYKFQIIRNALKLESTYLSELQRLALGSNQKHHLIAAIFWSTVLSDPKSNSMGAVRNRANAKLLEAKLAKAQLNELRARALLFRCEHDPKTTQDQ
jgi:hypothetical protein